jgi:hypothetical protein
MSHEYKLEFSSETMTGHVLDVLKQSDSCVAADEEFIYLKDRVLKTEAIYDVRMSHEGQRSLWLEVNLNSLALCDVVRAAIGEYQFRCLEDGDVDNEVTLSEAFLIRNIAQPERNRWSQ